MADTQVTDPLGRHITLHDRTWYGHIIEGHPEVAPMRAWVERALSQPQVIHVSHSDSHARLYFGASSMPPLLMLVVVDVRLGLVKTAHLARKTSGAEVEWSSPTPSRDL